jgi:hypothetical protein
MYAEADPPDVSNACGMRTCPGQVGTPHRTLRTSLAGWTAHGFESPVEWFWAQRGAFCVIRPALPKRADRLARERLRIEDRPDCGSIY